MSLRSIVRSILPAPLRTFLRRGRRHLRWRLAQTRGVVVKKEHLVSTLAQLGIRNGDVLLVHTSLSRLGHVEGGPEIIVDTLLELVGPHGTLLMPAFPVTADDWMTYINSDPIFDPRQSPSTMGKITDVFWRRPGVLRSLHPTHSVAAYGPHAAYLTRDHEKSQSPCGYTSPFRKLVELDGRILHLGSPFWSTTSFHVVEDVVPHFPHRVYLDPIPMRYLDFEDVEHVVPVKVHDPVTAATRIDKVKAKEEEIYNYCLERGIVRTERVGLATVHLIEARPLEQLLEELVEKGITIYAQLPFA